MIMMPKFWEMAMFVVVVAAIMVACAFAYNGVVPAYQ